MARHYGDALFERSAPGWGQLPDETLPEIAVVGRSNVGKSSLVNAVLRRKALARTSATPGKTREFNFYRIDDEFYLVDVPGFGYAKVARSERERWTKLIGKYVVERKALKLVLHLVDSRHEPTALDREVMGLMHESKAAYVILLTKTDKISGNLREKHRRLAVSAAAEAGLEVPVVLTSAEDGRGLDEVRSWIFTHTRS